MHWKRIKMIWWVVEGTDEHREVSRGVKQSLKGRQHPSLERVFEGRENRGPATIGEVPGSVRGLNRVQYPPRVNEQGWESS